MEVAQGQGRAEFCCPVTCTYFTGSRTRSMKGGPSVTLLPAPPSLEVAQDQRMAGLLLPCTCTLFTGNRTRSRRGGSSVALLPAPPSVEVAQGKGRAGFLLPCYLYLLHWKSHEVNEGWVFRCPVTCTTFTGSRTRSKPPSLEVAKGQGRPVSCCLLPATPSLEVASGQGRVGLLLPCLLHRLHWKLHKVKEGRVFRCPVTCTTFTGSRTRSRKNGSLLSCYLHHLHWKSHKAKEGRVFCCRYLHQPYWKSHKVKAEGPLLPCCLHHR